MSTSTTPTLITEALHRVTLLQLFEMTIMYNKVTAYTAQLTLTGLVSTMQMDVYATATNDTDYSCNIKGVHWPACTWFLKIVSVQRSVCVCVSVCVSAPEAVNN